MNNDATTHSVMFHHFHNDVHPKGQGSISGYQFQQMIDWLDEKYNLLSADEYQKFFLQNRLKKNDICLSFDDALLCQFDIAVPILNKNNLRAFFFVYSSPFEGFSSYLEVFRYFRTVAFSSIDEFYLKFFEKVQSIYGEEYFVEKKIFESKDYLSTFLFYTYEDRWFRFLRDVILGKNKYENLMLDIMSAHNYQEDEIKSKVWFDDNNIKQLAEMGHTVGLHSYSHPMMMQNLSKELQREEYCKNLNHLERLLGKGCITSMSHPCGNYNETTLSLLDSLAIKIGFRSSMSVRSIKSSLEIPREDHANVLRSMAE
jgi:peptidoglycan/xylan/chitin deacetylase (PgdA/CDA1 family)